MKVGKRSQQDRPGAHLARLFIDDMGRARGSDWIAGWENICWMAVMLQRSISMPAHNIQIEPCQAYSNRPTSRNAPLCSHQTGNDHI